MVERLEGITVFQKVFAIFLLTRPHFVDGDRLRKPLGAYAKTVLTPAAAPLKSSHPRMRVSRWRLICRTVK